MNKQDLANIVCQQYPLQQPELSFIIPLMGAAITSMTLGTGIVGTTKSNQGILIGATLGGVGSIAAFETYRKYTNKKRQYHNALEGRNKGFLWYIPMCKGVIIRNHGFLDDIGHKVSVVDSDINQGVLASQANEYVLFSYSQGMSLTQAPRQIHKRFFDKCYQTDAIIHGVPIIMKTRDEDQMNRFSSIIRSNTQRYILGRKEGSKIHVTFAGYIK